jgi:hypothetical protein
VELVKLLLVVVEVAVPLVQEAMAVMVVMDLLDLTKVLVVVDQRPH